MYPPLASPFNVLYFGTIDRGEILHSLGFTEVGMRSFQLTNTIATVDISGIYRKFY